MKVLFRAMVFLGELLAAADALAWKVEGGIIYDAAGQAVYLRGVSWSGFESEEHAGRGLSVRSLEDMLEQMQFLGLNAVRIPVCPESLTAGGVSAVEPSLNPDLAGKNALEVLDAVLAALDRRGIYFALDHRRSDCDGGASAESWLADLAFMASRYGPLGHFLGLGLQEAGGSTTDLARSGTERAAAVVLETAPDLLVFLEVDASGATCAEASGDGRVPWCFLPEFPADRLVLSPAVDIGAEASQFPDGPAGAWLSRIEEFRDAGYAVVPVETGGVSGRGGSLRGDGAAEALVDDLISRGIRSAFLASWDAGGSLFEADWQAVRQGELGLLTRLWGGPAGAAACGEGIEAGGCASPAGNEEADSAIPSGAGLIALLTPAPDLGSTHCTRVEVRNTASVPRLWQISLPEEGTVTRMRGALYGQAGGTLTARGDGWSRVIPVGGAARFEFCAER